jgi:thiamine-monophosphate kinase
VTLGLPSDRDPAWVEQMYSGLRQLAERHGVAVVGGETTTSPERVFISVSVLGVVPTGKAVLRSGAKPGDAVFVSGELGGSIAGRHLEFEPRLNEAQWLCNHFDLHSMIDLSDGLASDLRHVIHASGVGAELLADAIPISRAARLAAKASHAAKAPLDAALTDGEDFELLFTVSASDAVPLSDQWKQRFPGVRLGCIGRITDEPGVRVRDREGLRSLSGTGYVHFSPPET